MTNPSHIFAASCLVDERTRLLKHGDTFAVFDHYGDIKPGGLGEEGLYHEGTRYLSCFLLELEGRRPFFLSSTVRDENDQLAVTLTNPDLLEDGRLWAPLGTLHIAIRKFLWHRACYQQLRVKNYGLGPIKVALSLHFAADFADIFEVRGMKRQARGQDLKPEVSGDRVVLGYRGLDGEVRRTLLHFSVAPALLTASTARLDLALQPEEEVEFSMAVGCERASRASSLRLLAFDDARTEAESDLQRYSAWSCHLHASNGQVTSWIARAVADLHMMTTELPTGPYPYAGVPWFNTPFGRDGIITALSCLWLRPSVARGVLAYLASTQATEVIPEQDAEPGKILHETRNGEMAILKEMPFGRYYGSVDATPLFVVLAGAYWTRTGDRAFVESLWPHIDAALRWIDEYGDRDRDGFVEYHRQSGDGLVHQGWKDSDDAIFHADGSLAQGPIALCEVQGYVHAARKAGAMLAALLGQAERAAQLRRQAEDLRQRFEEAFWCEDISTYALALDRDKQPCRVRTSNAGQCLYTGIASPDRAWRVAQTLLSPESFSGWGVRTVATTEPRYNPMAYHNGSVWPHDNALIARGLAGYGLEPVITLRVTPAARNSRSGIRLPLWQSSLEGDGAANLDRHVRCQPVLRFAADARAVLRLCPGTWRGSRPLPGRLRAAGVVGRLGVPAVPGVPGTGDQRPRSAAVLHPTASAVVGGGIADSQPGGGHCVRRSAAAPPRRGCQRQRAAPGGRRSGAGREMTWRAPRWLSTSQTARPISGAIPTSQITSR
jgi:glycogen debranching enzyme